MAALRERVEQERGDRGAPAAMLDRRGLAHYIGVSVRTVDRMIERGELPRPRRAADRILRWLRTEVDEAISRWPVAGN